MNRTWNPPSWLRLMAPAWGLAAALAGAWSGPAGAVMDIEDHGPLLRAGVFSMRVSNVGVLGNPFIEKGLSFDPSFEYPSGSGVELMNECDLWIGGIGPDGRPHVSGAPRTELRPTPDPADRVLERWHGLPGTQPLVDDDGDGRIDEEVLNGRDDDGDGEVDEDLGIVGQQELDADYADDRPEAVHYVYPGGETHVPLGVSVHQRVMAWATPGYQGIAGLEFVITNHTDHPLHGIYLGLMADLDVRTADDPTGHMNDRLREIPWSVDIPNGSFLIHIAGARFGAGGCITHHEGTVLAAVDGRTPNALPAIALQGLSHTIDPIETLVPGLGRAPGKVSFLYQRFANSRPPGSGGLPQTDDARYAALQGRYPTSEGDHPEDVVVLMSCGPFETVDPGESLTLRAALVAAPAPDSLGLALSRAAWLHEGTALNLEPDSLGPGSNNWDVGRSGLNGHEVCIEPPPGVSFIADPNCPQKFPPEPAPPQNVLYSHGHCVWTDADCDACTGNGGNETVFRWSDPGSAPIEPRQAFDPLDHAVKVRWDNLPEILVGQGLSGPPNGRFMGYRLYKLADWRGRGSELPPRRNWAMIASFGDDSLAGAQPLAAATDTTLDYERVLYERKQYPVGRYTYVDHDVLDGFRYGYMVTSVTRRRVVLHGFPFDIQDESPLIERFSDTVVPRAAARDVSGSVWVVPNPYRASADWELPTVPGDTRTHHVDFMGLPRAQCRIRIWTLAGDLVAELRHDGRNGDGQAAWDLISRNGQDVVSGIYVFTLDSDLGTQTGRFVVIR
ncbi:MAG: hypothetical protein ACHQ52_09885 [Candidatus Eisenbacteria bacterium]